MQKHKRKRELQWTSSPSGGMLHPCLIPSHKAKRVPRSTHPRTKIQMPAMIGTGVMVIARETGNSDSESDGREGSLSLALTVPTLPFSQLRSRPSRRLEARGGVLVDGSNRTRQFGNSSTRACVHQQQQLVLARKREMLLAGRAPCLDMSPLLTPTDKLEPRPAERSGA